MTLRALFVPMLLLLCLTAIPAFAEKGYISQTAIDSTIQQAFYYFNAAGPEAGAPMTQEEAIVNARQVVERLTAIAQNDPNKQYILWKAGELADHIRLEEDEVRRKNEIANVAEVNELIAMFNEETAQWRPDFAVLFAVQEKVADIMPAKGNSLADLLETRQRNISKEALFLARKALNEERTDSTKKELEYLRKNRRYLLVSAEDITALENGIAILIKGEEIRKNRADIREGMLQALDRAARALSRKDVGGTRGELDMYDRLLGCGMITAADAAQFKMRASICRSKINAVEDSLMDAALVVLDGKGTDSALAFSDHILKKHNVSIAKISALENRIVLAGSSQSAGSGNPSVANDLAGLSDDTDNGSFYAATFSDIRARADKKSADKKSATGEKKAPTPIGTKSK